MREEKHTVNGAMRGVVERENWAVFRNETALNGMLADIATGEVRERKWIRLDRQSGFEREIEELERDLEALKGMDPYAP